MTLYITLPPIDISVSSRHVFVLFQTWISFRWQWNLGLCTLGHSVGGKGKEFNGKQKWAFRPIYLTRPGNPSVSFRFLIVLNEQDTESFDLDKYDSISIRQYIMKDKWRFPINSSVNVHHPLYVIALLTHLKLCKYVFFLNWCY